MRTRKPIPVAAPARSGSLARALEAVPDPRRPYGWRPEYPPIPLVALLQLSVAAILCGARSLYAIAQWSRERLEDEPGLLWDLGVPPERSPCVATLHRVFKGLDVEAFERALSAWLAQTGVEPSDPLALDGKTLRGIHGEDIPGVHLVAAYAHRAQAILDQLRTTGKGQELAAVLALVARLPLEGRLVTGDALLTQRVLCEQIVAGGGDYLLPVKDNQPRLRTELEEAFSPLAGDGCGGRRAAERADLAVAAGGGVRGTAELGGAGSAQGAPRPAGSAPAVGLGRPGDQPLGGQFRGAG
jgi:hypothetical protein